MSLLLRWMSGAGGVKRQKVADRCTCDTCRKVAALAERTREVPTPALYGLLQSFAPCPRSPVTWRGVVRQHIVPGSAGAKKLDQDSFEEADTVDGNEEDQTVPDPSDLEGWRAFKNDPALQAMWTAHSNEVHFAPLPYYHRVVTVFEEEPVKKHEYWVDGVHVNAHGDPNAWKSPSSEHVYKEFARKAISNNGALYKLKDIFMETVTTANDLPPRTPKEDILGILWGHLLRNRQQKSKVDKFWELVVAACTFTDPAKVHEAAATFAEKAATWGENDPEFEKVQETVVGVLAKNLLGKWGMSATKGVIKHDWYDCFVQHRPLPAGADLPLGFKRAMAYLAKDYDIAGSEVPLGDTEAHAIGCADLVLIDRRTGEKVIGDFKNCESDNLALGANYSEKGTHPFTQHLTATKFNKYLFQLSFYRQMLNLHYFPGKMSKLGVLINIDPRDPEGFQLYFFETMDMDPFWAYMKQRVTDPEGAMKAAVVAAAAVGVEEPDLPPTLVPRFPDTDPRCQGPTTGGRLPFGEKVLQPGTVWVGKKYGGGKNYPAVEESEWAHPTKSWFREPPLSVSTSYETYLLNNPEKLGKLPSLVGKQLLCWCDAKYPFKCNAEVLVKYANLVANGAIDVTPYLNATPFTPGIDGKVAKRKRGPLAKDEREMLMKQHNPNLIRFVAFPTKAEWD